MPIDVDAVARVLDSDAILAADLNNLDKLGRSYPSQVQAHRDYAYGEGDLLERLKKFGVEL